MAAVKKKSGSAVIVLILFIIFFPFDLVQAVQINNNEREGIFGFHTHGVTGTWVLGMNYPYSEDLVITANWLAGGEEGTSGIDFGLETSGL